MGLSFGMELRYLFTTFYYDDIWDLRKLHLFLDEWGALSIEDQHDLLTCAREEMDAMILKMGVVYIESRMIHGDRRILNPIGILNAPPEIT